MSQPSSPALIAAVSLALAGGRVTIIDDIGPRRPFPPKKRGPHQGAREIERRRRQMERARAKADAGR